MGKSIAQLKKERDILLRKARSQNDVSTLSREKVLEKRRLESEIRALKNPNSAKAKRFLISSSKTFGRFIKKRAIIAGDNLNRMSEEDERERKKKRQRMMKRKKLPKLRKKRKSSRGFTWES